MHDDDEDVESLGELTPRETYRRIMDEFADLANKYGLAGILESGHDGYADDPEGAAFVASLPADQRSLITGLLRRERIGGIHDALAELSWWIDLHGLELRRAGEVVFHDDESGEGLHGDFIDRLARDRGWPNRAT